MPTSRSARIIFAAYFRGSRRFLLEESEVSIAQAVRGGLNVRSASNGWEQNTEAIAEEGVEDCKKCEELMCHCKLIHLSVGGLFGATKFLFFIVNET